MKIEIIKNIQKVEEVDIELPYYYKYDLIIYGKIEANCRTSVHETENYDGEKVFEIKKSKYDSIKNSDIPYYYFEKQYASNKEEFEASKNRMLLFISNASKIEDTELYNKGYEDGFRWGGGDR